MSVKSVVRGARWAGILGGVVLMTGCAAGLDSVPLPSPGSRGGTYDLNAVFTDALNLPSKAKVRLYGADIGEVTSIEAVDFTAKVSMRIRHDVPLPAGSTAELRSATPLGDVFLQIRPPGESAGWFSAATMVLVSRFQSSISRGPTHMSPSVMGLK